MHAMIYINIDDFYARPQGPEPRRETKSRRNHEKAIREFMFVGEKGGEAGDPGAGEEGGRSPKAATK